MKVKTTIKVDKELWAKLGYYKTILNLDKSEIVEKALKEYIKKLEKAGD